MKTLDEIKLLAAKKLLEQLDFLHNFRDKTTIIFWKDMPLGIADIRETEWLHVCHLLEVEMKGQEIVDYTQSLIKETGCSGFMYYRNDIKGNERAWNEISGAACWFFLHATYQQRLQAMIDCGFLTP